MCTCEVSGELFPFADLGRALSNWARWGDDDQLGTLNHITPARVKSAAAAVRSGKRFDLSIPIGSDGPQNGQAGRVNPIHLMSIMPGDFDSPDSMFAADDFIAMPLQCATQWDGLAHIGYAGKLYNGVPAKAITAMQGATRNAIDATLPGVVGRGVLLDIARLKGVEWLPGGTEITPDDLELAAARQGVTVGPGDALLIRTGWRRKALVDGWSGWLESEPGLGIACARWLHDRDIAAIASDNWGLEVFPAPVGYLPLHCVLLRDMGMPIGEIFDFEALSADCDDDGQWDFLFSAPPLRVVGGIGSPTSPIAIK